MSSVYLVDTNVVSAFFERERSVVQKFTQMDFLIPFAVVGEIYAWAHSPVTRPDRLMNLHILLTSVPVLGPDTITGERYGLLYAALTRQGKPIPVNDMWIAALALQHDYIVATRDSDFARIPGLKIERW